MNINLKLLSISRARSRVRYGLIWVCPLGKTVSTLTAINELMFEEFEVNKVLIIAPLRVTNTTWHTEASKWEHLKDLTFSICTGSLKDRQKALQRTAHIYLINRENIEWLVEHYGKKFPFDMVIIDEASSFKSPSAKRFKALKKVRPLIDRMVELTGTPATNGYMDLWSQFFLLDSGKSIGRTITNYRQRFFDTDYMGYSYTLKAGADKQIQEAVSHMVLSMSAKDYLELPSFIPIVLNNQLEGKLLNQYKKFEKDMILAVNSEDKITAMSAATLTNKLLQFCSGNMYDEAKNVHHFHNLKLDTLQEIMDENPNENFLIAYNYKHELEALVKKYPKAVVLDKDGKAVQEWNEGKIKMLLAHPACIDGDTEVLTEYRGWIKLIDVKITDRVYDGVEFVSHKGCQFSGVKEVINRFGIDMTLDHKFLVNNKWKEAKDVSMEDERKGLFKYNGDDTYLSRMCGMWEHTHDVETKRFKSKQTWRQKVSYMYKKHFPQYDKYSNMENLERDEREVSKYFRQKLWSSRDNLRASLGRVQRVLCGYGRRLSGAFNIREKKCEYGVFKRKLCLGNNGKTTSKQTNNKICNLSWEKVTFSRVCSCDRFESMCFNHKIKQRDEYRRGCGECEKFKVWNKNQAQKTFKKVYDLVDCGERNRFLVRNKRGEIYISHNSAGHGLNLQHGGNVLIWYGFTWSLELYQQFNARLYRQGQKNIVRCFHIAVGEVEGKLMKTLAKKDATQEELLESLKG